ncbi:hypothetical protein N7481_009924 [Penicillium waksmanii]|uniref:uncharacterized protein n=1 Tax=Penicillium waksmanii TaxID=69791 RepID=UPI0025469AD1|nr:uncharacterized protein N7481_009924 [Penicillium waksmanii]KAJ5976217.1 hypothetical protein N7481_009924 [Penicillium waksmanii]
MEPLRFKKYTDECCKIIEVELESATDVFLVHLVRTMHLADRIVHTICFDEFDYPGLSGPLGLSIRGFEPDLRKMKTSFSCESPYSSKPSSPFLTRIPPHTIYNADILNLHYDTLEILLYQVALSEELSDAECSGYTLTRLDILFRCLQATKSFFNGFNSLSSHCFTYLPFTIWCQFGHAVVALSRLSLFQSEIGWDLEYVQNTIDFNQTIDRLMHKLEGARQLIERESGPQPTAQLPEAFGRLSNRMRLMKECHRQRKEALDKSRSQEIPDPADFDLLFNMSLDTYFPFDDFLALGEGAEIPQNL